jgi:hypothetical protein
MMQATPAALAADALGADVLADAESEAALAAEILGAGLLAEAASDTALEAAAAARAATDAAYPVGFPENIVLANGRPGHRSAAAFFRSQGRCLADRAADAAREARQQTRRLTARLRALVLTPTTGRALCLLLPAANGRWRLTPAARPV